MPVLRLAIAATIFSMERLDVGLGSLDRKSTRLNSSHDQISYAVFCLKKKTQKDAPCLLAPHARRGAPARDPDALPLQLRPYGDEQGVRRPPAPAPRAAGRDRLRSRLA